jgi:hypothetical protein
MNKLRIPIEFEDICSIIDWDPTSPPHDEREMINAVVRDKSSREKIVALDFVQKILDGEYSGKDLEKIWNRMAPRVMVASSSEYRPWFAIIRDVIKASLDGQASRP